MPQENVGQTMPHQTRIIVNKSDSADFFNITSILLEDALAIVAKERLLLVIPAIEISEPLEGK
jgi:hypothetical protein